MSKDFRAKSDLLNPDLVIAPRIRFASVGVNRAVMKMVLAFSVPIFGRPITFLNAVANNQEYIGRVKLAVEHPHNCGAIHRATVPVHEVFRGQMVWEGDVEVFDLKGHPKAKRAYAWSHCDGKDDQDEKFVAVLEIQPVESAQTAVKVAIVAEAKNARKKH